MIKIFNADDTVFNTNGNIAIKPLKCIETKKKSLNGWYIDVEIPIKYKEYIKQDMLCVIKTKSKINPQAFRINNVECKHRTIIFQADHVSSDAKNYFLLDVRPVNLNGLNTLTYINDRTDKQSPFFITSNVSSINTAYFIRKSLFEAWSIIEERWNGVFDFDNWNVNFKTDVGVERGEIIAYGKNLQGIKIFEDWSNVVTKLYPTGKEELMLPEQFIESDIQYDKPYTKTIQFETSLNEEEQTEENLINELRQKTIDYLEENQYPKVSYEVTSDINQQIEIGDIIQVKHPLVNLTTEVLEYDYDVLTKRVNKIIFGNFTRDVRKRFDLIKQDIKEVINKVSTNEQMISNQSNIINNLNKLGNVYITDNEILVLDKLPLSEAENVLRIGLGGIGFSSTGYEGPFTTAWTLDGKFNADFIRTGKLSVDRIENFDQIILEVNNKIDDIANFTKNITFQGDLVQLPNTPNSNGAIRQLRIRNFQLMELYPGMAYPSDFVYPGALNFYMLIFDNVDTFNNNPHYVYINSPIPLQSLNFEGETYHNELVIEENKVKIIETIKWNFETEQYEILPIPTVHELTTVVLPTFEVDTYLRVDYFTDLIFEAEYLIKNEFTDTFATQTESSTQFTINSEEIATKVSKDNIISEINQSPEEVKINANKITLRGNEEFSSTISQLNNKINDIQNQVDGKVSTWYGADVPTLYNYPADGWITEEERNNHLGDLYYDDNGQAYRFSFQDNEYFWKEIADSDVQAMYEELNSKITQTATDINLEVSKKTNKTEIISTINQSAEAVTINASKISLAGKTIDLTSDNIVIDSTNFKVTKSGIVTATGVNISGTINATSGSFTGSITASSGKIAGWTINGDILLSTDGRVAIAGGSHDGAFWAGGGWSVDTPLRLYKNGLLVAKNADITGTINATSGTFKGTVTGSTINGSNANFGNSLGGGKLSYYNGVGFMTCGGGVSTHPWFSAVNISRQNGIYFYSGTDRNNVGKHIGSIHYINNWCTITTGLYVNGNINAGSGHYTGPNGTNYGHLYINDRVVLVPRSGYKAYVNSATAANQVAVSSSGPSSRNVKENLKELKYGDIYKDLQKLNTYTFDYKYDGIKDDKTDFGFIIDEVEELPTISKFAKHYDVDGYIKDGKLIPKRDEDKEQDSMKKFNYKEWDRDSYIKLLLLFIKSLQEKVDSLEVKYEKAN